jgi:futalosine hydrolase
MRIAIFAATTFEIEPLRQFLTENWTPLEPTFFQKNDLVVQLCVSGIGPIETALFLGKYLIINELDLAINAGIAGSFDLEMKLGDVVQVAAERFGDLGVEQADGSFDDLFDLDFLQKNEPPFSNGLLKNSATEGFDFLPKKQGLTVSCVHGTDESIQKIKQKYPEIDVETMEGAAFFRACLDANLPFLEIRAISNYVEKRNRANWKIGLAIDQLNQVLVEILAVFAEPNLEKS